MFRASLFALMLSASPLAAHEWYPLECCSGQDCWPAGDHADAREPEPRITPNGYVLYDGTVIAFRDARPSPDSRYHVCRRGGDPAAAVIIAGKPCLWVPSGSS